MWRMYGLLTAAFSLQRNDGSLLLPSEAMEVALHLLCLP